MAATGSPGRCRPRARTPWPGARVRGTRPGPLRAHCRCAGSLPPRICSCGLERIRDEPPERRRHPLPPPRPARSSDRARSHRGCARRTPATGAESPAARGSARSPPRARSRGRPPSRRRRAPHALTARPPASARCATSSRAPRGTPRPGASFPARRAAPSRSSHSAAEGAASSRLAWLSGPAAALSSSSG